MAQNKDYYNILGVDKNADEKQIKSAYRKLALKFHPDRNPNNKDAEEKFKDISEAYRILSDKDLRQRYDMFGTVDDNFGGSNMNAEDVFKDFFRHSGFNSFGGFSYEEEPQQKQVSGTDKVLHINVTLSEIYNNVDKTVKYTVNRPCKKCGGSGSTDGKSCVCPQCNGTGQVHIRKTHKFGFMEQVVTCPHCHGTGVSVEKPCPDCKGTGLHLEEEQLTIKVPTIDKVLQQVYNKTGGGNSAPNNLGVNGNLRFKYVLNEDDKFKIDRENGLNIVTQVNVSVIDCLLGASTKIKHLDGKEYSINVPQCTKDGSVLRMNGKGFRHSNGYVGDLLIKVNMIMPKTLTEDNKKLLNKLQKSKTFKIK